MCVLVAQLCSTFCDPVTCSPPGFSVRGILQARILEWVPIPFSNEYHSGLIIISTHNVTEDLQIYFAHLQ